MDPDAHSVFEYSTLKVPYEELNQKYRTAHKKLEKSQAAVRQAACALQSQLKHEGNDPVPAEKVSGIYSELEKRVAEFRETVKDSMEEEKAMITTLQKRVEHLEKEEQPPRDELERWHQNRERTNRLAIGYLLRCGRIETARAFAKKAGLEEMVDIEIFERAHQIEAALMSKESGPCLRWIDEHRSRLRKMNSTLEQYVRIQDCIELIRAGQRVEAVKYARRHLGICQRNEMVDDVLTLWGLLAVNVHTNIDRYSKMLDENRWSLLADMFRGEFGNLYQLPGQSPFSICIQCGLSAFKTPECTPGGNEKCVTCQPSAFTLAEGLPHAHTGQSSLRCAYSGDPLNEANPPWMLPTGRVYGERSLEKLTKGPMVLCPRTNAWVPRDECLRVFVL